jgi:16S rRNA (uracil1498-N3)-methyltransferase
LDSVFLSNTELYYATPESFTEGMMQITGEEYYHLSKVMRHKPGDMVNVTNGKGEIFKTEILSDDRKSYTAEIKETRSYENPLKDIYFCLPKLKSADRFEFALEKCVELGITNFVIFEAKRSVSKGFKLERWNKITLAAMKQSLRAWLPEIKNTSSVKEIMALEGEKIIFEQEAEKDFSEFRGVPGKNYFFIFGPEGGLDKSEMDLLSHENQFRLAANRLRSETAIILTAGKLNL